MTKSEALQAVDEINIEYLMSTASRGQMNGGDKQWIMAFEFYNSMHDKKFGMHCRPCFFHVMHFLEGYKLALKQTVETNAK